MYKYGIFKIERKGGKNLNNNELKPRRWLLVVLLLIAIAIIIVLLNKLIVDHNAKKQNRSSNGISNIINNQMEKGNEMLDKFEIDSFNSKFEFRVGQNYGSSVMHVLDDVIINNKKNQNHILTVVFEGLTTTDPEEIKNAKNNIDEWTKYEISVDYDENGYVNKITIEK